jgi:Protein of unknown function (DUF2938)
MNVQLEGVVVGFVATAAVDAWAIFVKNVLGLPTANWALVGRWFAYMPQGVFVHRPISSSTPIEHELAIGWVAHYCVGIIYGLAYVAIVQFYLSGTPTFASALAFGLVTLIAPWFVMQPGMGAGVCASRTARPTVTRWVNLSMHLIFGATLYIAWRLF